MEKVKINITESEQWKLIYIAFEGLECGYFFQKRTAFYNMCCSIGSKLKNRIHGAFIRKQKSGSFDFHEAIAIRYALTQADRGINYIPPEVLNQQSIHLRRNIMRQIDSQLVSNSYINLIQS